MKTKWKAIICSLLRLIAVLIAVLFLTKFVSPICNQDGEMNWFLMCVLIGIPFGMGKAILLFPPARSDLGTSMGILALDCLIGGMIGFVVLCVEIIKCVIKVIAALFM